MTSFEERLLMYRQMLRRLLYENGVVLDPGVDDAWVLDRVAEVMRGNRPRVGVGVFIFRDGKFLMGKRRNAHGDGSWSIPGGNLEFGESYAQAAIREAREETGLEVRNPRFGAVTNDIFKAEGKHYTTIWMLSECPEGEPVVMEPDKFTHMEWFTFRDLPAPLFLPWTQLLPSEFIQDIRRQADTTATL